METNIISPRLYGIEEKINQSIPKLRSIETKRTEFVMSRENYEV